MRVVLKASDVAAIIGLNPYKPRREVLDDLWKKYSPGNFTGKTKKDRAQEALSVSREVRNVVHEASTIKAKNSDEVQTIFNDAKQKVILDQNLSKEQKSEIIEHLKSQVYTNHGTRSEDTTASRVETTGSLTRDDAFYTLDVCTLGNIQFVVVGKIDRIEELPDGGRILVEIKNRTNRLFRRVVEYENIQVQVYLQMLGLIHARLVEQYNNQILSHEIDRDEEIWQNVIRPGLEEFCQEIYLCMCTLPVKKSSNVIENT
jgi:hypothetical protein